MIESTRDEIAAKLFGENMPAWTVQVLGLSDHEGLYRRLHLARFYRELARVLGRTMTPAQWYETFLLAGYSHGGEWGLDEAKVRELQRLMRNVVIPTLIPEAADRTAVLQSWDRNFS